MIKTSDTAAIATALTVLAPFTASNFSGRAGNADTEAVGSFILGWGDHIKESAAAAIYTVWSYGTAIAWTADGTHWTMLAENPGKQTTAKQMSALRTALESMSGDGITVTTISRKG